jgi:abelson tyrosine-protein kinase 1
VHFNVFSSPKAGPAWGMFTTEKVPVLPKCGGSSYYEVAPGSDDRLSASKVSVGQGWDTVLMAKLRFRPHGSEPTSL